MKSNQRLLVAGCFSLLLAACSSTDSKQEVAAAEVANPDEVTCKTVVKTGTRIGTRVCRTNRAWAQLQEQSRAYAEGIQRRGMQGQTYQTEGGQ